MNFLMLVWMTAVFALAIRVAKETAEHDLGILFLWIMIGTCVACAPILIAEWVMSRPKFQRSSLNLNNEKGKEA